MSISVGFEVGTGRAIEIPLRHLAVTGQTQESGKTTTLEALIVRSELRAVAFVTKRGESSFHVANPIPPYFRERCDWPFVASILEATMSERLKFQRAWIMKLCQARHSKNETWSAPRTLADVQRNVEAALEKARGMNESVYTELREYLKMVVPQIDRLPYSPQLDLNPGVNVMDLAPYDFPLQALVVRSVVEWIHKHERNTISVIPEAWKFAPKQRGSPVRLAAEELIREGGALKNFIWLDSQDIAGVADVLLRQVGVWIFGVQRASHEIDRTLKHIPENLQARPKRADIATLGKGQFIVCWERQMYKIYVQPAWMSPAHAQAIARGEEEVDSAKDILYDFDSQQKTHARTHKASVGVGENPPNKSLSSSQGTPAHSNPAPTEEVPAIVTEIERLIPDEDDAMYKEKYEKLKAELDQIKNDKRFKAPFQPTPIPEDMDGLLRIYGFVKERAQKDPELLQLLISKPELHVTVKRTKIEVTEDTLKGRLAHLISQGFFDQPKTGNAAFDQIAKRQKFRTSKPNVYRECDALTTMGFLVSSDAGYKAVEGMKIRIVET